MISLETPIEELSRVGKSTASRLHRMGIWTVRDLLFHFPHRHEDFSSHKQISDLQPGQEVTITATLTKISGRSAYTRSKLHLTNAVVSDESGSIEVVWFNQPFLLKQLVPGTKLSLSGKIDERGGKMSMRAPKYEIVKPEGVKAVDEAAASSEMTYTGRLLPVYPLSMNLTQRQIQFLMSLVLPLVVEVPDPFPAPLREQYRLPDLAEALKGMHAPESQEEIDAARKRLAFEELFYLQLQMHELQSLNRQEPAQAMKFFEDEVRAFVASLPFELTPDQKKTAYKVFMDLETSTPMNRLVQGDVGSGKTVVAAMAMYNVALNGQQSALMAPTEVLALQHFQNFTKLFEAIDVPLVLSTRSYRVLAHQGETRELTKKEIEAMLAQGEAAFAIGTHTLIQGTTKFRSLALAVVDEQHRFGVEQRKALRSRSGEGQTMPHLLSMTATPIPRTLMLALYGDLSVSSIKTRPKNRLPIQTKIVFPKERDQMYAFVTKQLLEGRQAYVVCPLIEENDELGVASVEKEVASLKKVFADYRVEALHGQLSAAQKESLMRKFKEREIHILVATTVIEVGVDVPNATVMIIEGAERFGLSQLHQIRGRVGRSDQQSYCYLAMSQFTRPGHDRLKKFIACDDGFAVAELDLSIRGAGDMLGTKQSGLAELQFVNIADTGFVEMVQQAVVDFMAKHKLEEFPRLAEHIRKRNERVHLE